MFVNRMPRYEPLSEQALATIEAGVERLAREVGVQFDDPRALALFAEAGQTVDGETVRFDPGFLRAQARAAGVHACARVRERDPRSAATTWCSSAGCRARRSCARRRERRDGTLADLERFLRLVQIDANLDTPGRNIVEPNDLPLDVRHLVRALASIRGTDRDLSGRRCSTVAAEGTQARRSLRSCTAAARRSSATPCCSRT